MGEMLKGKERGKIPYKHFYIGYKKNINKKSVFLEEEKNDRNEQYIPLCTSLNNRASGRENSYTSNIVNNPEQYFRVRYCLLKTNKTDIAYILSCLGSDPHYSFVF